MAPWGGHGWSRKMQTYQRTNFKPPGVSAMSSLHAPIVRFKNHKSEVLSCDFHPTGNYIVSSNRNGQINICDIYETFSKMLLMRGHTGAVLQTHFSSDGFDVYSCSADETVGIWDTFKGFRKAKFEGHTDAVNDVNGTRVGYPLLSSGSSDGTVRIWDTREKQSVLTFVNGADVTATSFNHSGEYLFTGGIDKDIKIWDMRRRQLIYKLKGHKGTITGISLSPCGKLMLSHSNDDTLRIWDISPFIEYERALGIIQSNQIGVGNLLRCAWSKDGNLISAATSQQDVLVWDPITGVLLYELPGHENSINDVAFHPKENIILSASNDQYLFLHELYGSGQSN